MPISKLARRQDSSQSDAANYKILLDTLVNSASPCDALSGVTDFACYLNGRDGAVNLRLILL